MQVDTVLVVGQGYVGSAVAAQAAQRGLRVTGFDTNAARAAALNDSRPYRVVSDASALGAFDVAVIAVPTLLEEGIPDLRSLRAAASVVGRLLSRDALVIVESTVFPGATRTVVAPILEEESGLRAGVDFALGHSPERMDPGPTCPDFASITRVVGGIDDASTERIQSFYAHLGPQTFPVSTIEVAELSKLIENTFRYINIAFVNELALSEATLGVDVREALDAAATKPYGFMKFTPSVGVGGDCIPVSPFYLNWGLTAAGADPLRFVELAKTIDRESTVDIVDQAELVLAERGLSIRGARIMLVGAAYKKDVTEVRDSPTLTASELFEQRGASVCVCDPLIPAEGWPKSLERVDLDPLAIASCDLAVVLVEHTNVSLEPLMASGIPLVTANRRQSALPTSLPAGV